MLEPSRAWVAVRRLRPPCAAPAGTALATGAVSLADAAAGAPSADGLSPGEQARAQGITAPHRRAQFIAARWLAREVLAAGWGGAPHDWALSAPVDGPPAVIGAPQGARPHVSISHSGEWLACAASEGAIGVDIEAPARERDVEALVHAICTAGELEHFNALPKEGRHARFYALWTLKEAWIKRRAEHATPGRMARIDACLATSDADGGMCAGRTWQHGGLTLALVTSGGAPVWLGAQPFGDMAADGWTLEDEAAPDSA